MQITHFHFTAKPWASYNPYSDDDDQVELHFKVEYNHNVIERSVSYNPNQDHTRAILDNVFDQCLTEYKRLLREEK